MQDAALARIEAALPPVVLSDGSRLALDLDDWMQALGVPGLSLAIIDDYRVVHTVSAGVTEAGTGAPVTAGTIFQAASIAKPVAAMTALSLVEDGALSLDGPIDPYLGGWTLSAADPAVVHRPGLAQLLTHCGGVTPGGFRGYAQDAAIPDLKAVLDGAAPATNPPARIVAEPGQRSVYSGLGYEVVQLAIETASGQGLNAAAQARVFGPLGLKDTAFVERPLDGWAGRLASGHLQSGAVVPGRWAVQPELSAAGLWTTAPELAAIAIEAGLARNGRSERVLSTAMSRRMLANTCGEMGLGWISAPDAPAGLFSHAGGNTGFTGNVRLLADTGDGLVVLTNSDGGRALIGPLVGAVEQAWGWPGQPERALPVTTWLILIDHSLGAERALAEYRAVHGADADTSIDLVLWGYALLEQDRTPDALRIFDEATSLFGDDPYVWIHRARGQLRAGDRPGARASLGRALALEPDNEMARDELAAIDAGG